MKTVEFEQWSQLRKFGEQANPQEQVQAERKVTFQQMPDKKKSITAYISLDQELRWLQ